MRFERYWNATAIAVATVFLLGWLAAPFGLSADFYQGRQLTIMVGQPPGGSYDLYAQLAARHLSKHIPGNPTVLVEYRPGGGGSRATAYFYNGSPKDGTVIGHFPETIAHTQLLEPKRGRWDMRKMTYIGSFAPVNATFVVRKEAPATTVEGLRHQVMNVGCTGKNSQSYQMPAMMKTYAGFQLKIICGYKGSAESVLALSRGEVDMVSSAWNSWRSNHWDKIESGDFIPVVQGGLTRNAELPDVPLMHELVEDAKLQKVLMFVSLGASIGRALIAPPGIPADRLQLLRDGFDKMVRDQDFIEDATKRRLLIEPSNGLAVDKVKNQIMDASKEILELAAQGMQ